MKKSDSQFAGKILLAKRATKEKELAELKEARAALVHDVKRIDSLIAATKAYLRELDIRAGAAPSDRRLIGALSIREMAMQVLEAADRPLQVAAIRQAIEERFSRRVERTTIAPILSKLAQYGKLHHDDVGWSLPK